MKTCTELAHAIAHATKQFLSTAAFTPTKRQDAAKELQTFINHTEPQVEQYASDPDWADTAAAMMHLDLIISVDTSVCHLAGALARPVWVVLPFASEWRWMRTAPTPPGTPA